MSVLLYSIWSVADSTTTLPFPVIVSFAGDASVPSFGVDLCQLRRWISCYWHAAKLLSAAIILVCKKTSLLELPSPSFSLHDVVTAIVQFSAGSHRHRSASLRPRVLLALLLNMESARVPLRVLPDNLSSRASFDETEANHIRAHCQHWDAAMLHADFNR
ncbi:hypothetical protein OE88DRAFT_1645395 [Heliocybe sulcata]|uniref:Uncharacterized protein n=1 Tax=Heliocybe sulcata TaxID=5364 RepID=A0A5C3MYB0_9AGAM|nr:hypothetical protein OE88DRAFT_1645395 [Heliocybe sulcata]